MRRTLILTVLPFAFCLIPLLGAALIVLALPELSKKFYLANLSSSYLDQLILGLGSTLFVAQILLTWRALRWRGLGFDERPDKWLSNLAQGAEWFPLLGLLGTVAGILQTFSQVGASSDALAPQRIIELYAPAITATGSGLFMALLNIFPTWIVLVGRQLILSLAGGETTTDEEEPAGSGVLSNPR